MQATRKRAIASCSECYVRKQKCDRKYPCCHCSRRRRPEICSYAASDATQQTPNVNTTIKSTDRAVGTTDHQSVQERGTKRGRITPASQVDEDSEGSKAERRKDHAEKLRKHESSNEGFASQGDSPGRLGSSDQSGMLSLTTDDDNVSLRLGYADHSSENLAGLMRHFGLLDHNQSSNVAFQQVRLKYFRIMEQNLPKRIIVDTLVQNFFQEANWMYEAIYSPTFLIQYQDWWKSSPGTQIEDVSFATLLMRICAYTTQFLPSTTYTAATIDGESLSSIRDRCHNLATTLTSLQKSSSARPLHSDVLQLFYAACYCKNEGRVKDAWNILGEAIQLALDLGMHEERKQIAGATLTEFELEMRRRTFWNLYIWDRFMSVVLDRWARIPEDRCTVSYPTMRFSPGPRVVNAPDMFIERLLQVRLARVWFSEYWPSYGQAPAYDKHLVEAKYVRLHKEFLVTLPPAFALDRPDHQWDVLVPNIKKRRQILYVTIYAVLSNMHRLVLRLSRDEIEALPFKERELTYQHRMRFVDHTLKLLHSISNLHMLLGGSQTRLFILSFYTFEAAMQLGMYLLELNSIDDLYACYHTTSSASPHSTTSDGSSCQSSDPWKKARCLQEMSKALDRLRLLGEVSVIAKIGARKLTEMLARVKPCCSKETSSYSESSTVSTVDSTTCSPAELLQNDIQEPHSISSSEWQAVDFSAAEWSASFGGEMSGLENDLSCQPDGFDSLFIDNGAAPSVSPHWPTILSGNETWQSFQGCGDFMPNAMDSEQFATSFLTSVPPLPQDPFYPSYTNDDRNNSTSAFAESHPAITIPLRRENFSQ